jgi:hypothetical protein
MPPEVEAELMALGVKHNNTGDPNLSDEENFTEGQRATLKAAFIWAVETYWEQQDLKDGPTDASVRENIKEIRDLIRKLIKKLEALDVKTADGLAKFDAAAISSSMAKYLDRKELGLADRLRIGHEALWRTERAANCYLREELLTPTEARKVFWNSTLDWQTFKESPRISALILLWDGIAKALGEQQTLSTSGSKVTGDLSGFLKLFCREAAIKRVQLRTVADDLFKAMKIRDQERHGDS